MLRDPQSPEAPGEPRHCVRRYVAQEAKGIVETSLVKPPVRWALGAGEETSLGPR